MVWIHGGAFVTGSSSEPFYDGYRLASEGDMVIVTINYRLGPLGFAYFGHIDNREFEAASNNGIRDQIAALRWVRSNIEHFGGDPNNVTLFGESAGGMSVSCLLAAPSAQGLFNKVIAQSGSCNVVIPTQDAERVTETFLRELGISTDNLHKLYDLDPNDFLKTMPACLKVRVNALFGGRYCAHVGVPFTPVGDGDILPQDPLQAIRDGGAQHIPLLIGTCLDEWRFFVYLGDPEGKNLDETGLSKVCKRRIGVKSTEVIERYRQIKSASALPLSPPDLFAAIESDRLFRVPAIRLAEAQSRLQAQTYMYLLDWPSPSMNGAMGTCHAIDIPLVFGTVNSEMGRFLTGGGPEAEAFSTLIRKTWLTFARMGNPNHDQLSSWPKYTTNRRGTMILTDRPHAQDAPLDAERAVWDDIL